jgi:hypothetical protein
MMVYLVMNRRTQEERLKQVQPIVARYMPKDCDLIAGLIAERRAEAAAECSDALLPRGDLVGFDKGGDE